MKRFAKRDGTRVAQDSGVTAQEPDDSAPARAAELAHRQEEAALARADLTRLHHDLVEAEERVVTTNAAHLQEANEQLLVATLKAQMDARAYADELK